jgi:arylformamidase
MKIYDISLPLTERLPVWPGEPKPQLSRISSIEDGADANVSELRVGTHAGTHLDAPLHLRMDGQPVDAIPLDTLIGDAWVCRLPGSVTTVTAEALEAAGIPGDTTRLLIATANEQLWNQPDWSYSEDYVALNDDAARWIAARGMVLVGIDYISIETSSSSGMRVHHMLDEAGVVPVEGLDLRGVAEGRYRLVCLPLKLPGADGAPVRAVLIEE